MNEPKITHKRGKLEAWIISADCSLLFASDIYSLSYNPRTTTNFDALIVTALVIRNSFRFAPV